MASTIALADGSFRIAGQLMSSSFAQDGPQPNFLSSWVFDYITDGIEGIKLDIDKLKHTAWSSVAVKISDASTDEDFQDALLADDSMDILSQIGYRGVPQREKLVSKEKILRSMYIKTCIEPKLPMLDQLADGLQLFDVLRMLRECKEQMRKSFTADYRVDITPDVLLGIMTATFSYNQQLKDLESLTYKVFCEFIQLLHYGIEDCEYTVEDVMKFITGCTQLPALGFPNKITVTFRHGCRDGCKCRPTSSTCDLEL
eukprot:gene1483-1640_t